MASWLLAGLAPGLKPYATPIRVAVLVLYLLGSAAFALYALIW